MFGKGFIECIVAVQVVMAPEPGILFVAIAVVNQDQPVAVLYQQAAEGPAAEIVFVGGVLFVPHGFGHNAEHGAAVELKKNRY